MAIVIEDGSQVTGANSYATEAELQAYADARGVTLSGVLEQLLIKAMDYLESLSYKGMKTSSTQPLQWPRSGAVVDGYSVASDEIPTRLVQGQLATALAIDAGNDPLAPVEPAVKREKVGPLETEYQDGASARTYDAASLAALRPLMAAGSGFATFAVSRA